MADATSIERKVALRDFLSDKDRVKLLVRALFHEIPMREAVQLHKRVNYFRGRKLTEQFHPSPVARLTSPKLARAIPCLPSFFPNLTEEECLILGESLLFHGFIHASKVKDKVRRELQPINISESKFTADGYYTWLYSASTFKRNFLLGAIIFGFLSLVMFPIWPQVLKNITWYISVTLSLVFLGLILIRLALFLLAWPIGVDFWLFPNLFDDEAGFLESFQPFVSFKAGFKEVGLEGWLSRASFVSGMVFLGIWIYNQPTELDSLMAMQSQFVADLYDGTLLSDESHKTEEDLDRIVPDLEELQRQMEEEEREEDELEAFFDSLGDEEETEENEEEEETQNKKEEL